MLTEEQLRGIRDYLAERQRVARSTGYKGQPSSLLRHLADLLSHVEGLQLLIADLLDPAGDGSDSARRLYERATLEERGRCVARLRQAATALRKQASAQPTDSEIAYVWREQADAFDAAAYALDRGDAS